MFDDIALPKRAKPDVGWKVVEAFSDHYVSIHNYGPPDSPFRVYYKIDTWSTSPMGGLLVFNDRKYAEDLIFTLHDNAVRSGNWRDLHLFKCQCWQKMELPAVRLLAVDVSVYAKSSRKEMEEECMRSVWANGNLLNSLKARLTSWPEGTVAYKYVKPVDEANTSNPIIVAA